MKTTLEKLIALLAVAVLAGCAKDNYTEPDVVLNGRVVYNGQPVGVRDNAVQLELWESGWQLRRVIPVYVRNDGTFTATLFDGNYKLVRKRDNGPWVNVADSIDVRLTGPQTLDVPVTPFFNLKNEKIERSGSKINATVNVEQLVADRRIERVSLYVGTTQYVDANFNAGKTDLPAAALTDLTKTLALSYDLGGAAARSYVFARVGVKTIGVPELLYTQVVKINAP